ncbi:hypothetical protein C8T65DRAFT_64798 [Cerioporus squamosus]|nr:hypothetical protein C8T65DRAFT_64798 [Cerioporus squamosus]
MPAVMGVGSEEACSGWSLDGRPGRACCTKHDRRSQMNDIGAASCRQRAQPDAQDAGLGQTPGGWRAREMQRRGYNAPRYGNNLITTRSFGGCRPGTGVSVSAGRSRRNASEKFSAARESAPTSVCKNRRWLGGVEPNRPGQLTGPGHGETCLDRGRYELTTMEASHVHHTAPRVAPSNFPASASSHPISGILSAQHQAAGLGSNTYERKTFDAYDLDYTSLKVESFASSRPDKCISGGQMPGRTPDVTVP